MKNFLIFIIGLPCSGKSTVAKAISEKYKFIHLATEDVRAEFLGKDFNKSEDCDFTPKQHKIVYAAVANRAKKALNNGRSVIVDGVYRNPIQRAPIIELTLLEVIPLFYFLNCDEEESFRRLIQRKKVGTTAPAGVNAFKKIRKEFIYPNEADFTCFDTTLGTKLVIKDICEKLEGYLNA